MIRGEYDKNLKAIIPIFDTFKSKREIMQYAGLPMNTSGYQRLKKFITLHNLKNDLLNPVPAIEQLYKLSDEEFNHIVTSSGTVAEVCKRIGITGGNAVRRVIKRISINSVYLDPYACITPPKKWTAKDDQVLKDHYETCSVSDVQKLIPQRSHTAIMQRAIKLNLNSPNEGYYNSCIDVLLNDSTFTYYWIGFLLADGHFSNNRLTVVISIDDHDHLLKFHEYIQCKSSIKHYANQGYTNNKIISSTSSLSVMNTQVISKLNSKFDIKSNKTKIPPIQSVFESMTDNQFLSLFIGFIDGDGCVKLGAKRTFPTIAIKCHANWLNNFEYWRTRLEKIYNTQSPSPKINAKGYVQFNINKAYLVTELKQFTITHNLPVMKRKWDKIDVDIMKLKTKRFRKESCP